MLTGMLAKAVEADPAKSAIVQGSRRVRYDELEMLAGRCAAGLRHLGVGAGDCVAVTLPNGPEFVACFFACARVRAVMLPLDPHSAAAEWLGLVTDARVLVVITDQATSGLLATTDVAVVDVLELLTNAPDPMPSEPFRGPALYLYTSGSTDARKRLCCTQENLYYEALNFVESVGLTAADNILCTIPLHHSYGIGNCLLDAVFTGSTLVLLEPGDVPFAARSRRVLQLIREEAVRFYPGVPYQFQILAALLDEPKPDLGGLRLCVSSGDVLPRRTYELFRERFGMPIRSLYGSTEAGSIAINTDPAEVVQFGSLGLPLKNVAIRICDESGRELPDGKEGQIWVKSAVIPPTGYDNRPEQTAQVFRAGYYNTGDVGKKDARGHLLMTGRKQTFIDVGGHKVDVGEVEEVLQSHPRVREAAALGVEAPGLGTLLKAVVAAGPGCGEAELLAHCRERLAPFKVPRLIEFCDTLPRSSLGKVLKAELSAVPVALLPSPPLRGSEDEGEEEQRERLAALIQEQAALCRQCEPASISRSAPFQSMGFDSLRATELHLRLVKLTGLPLSITMLWNYPNIDELAAALCARTGAKRENGAATKPARPARAHLPFDDVLSEVEGMSESDVDDSFRAK
jgi:long-chain acyl-CoA synthetase